MYNVHGLREKLALGKFVTTVELEPPKGADPLPTMEAAKFLRGKVDAVNIADSPMATLRMSPIALAHIVQEDLGLEAIFHLTCRDRNLLGLQSELLGAAALGVRNILTLTGDSPSRGDHPEVKGVFETDSIGLARLAERLNQGYDLTGHELNGPTRFLIGGVANPGAEDLDAEVAKLAAKVEVGVRFVQTQPVFDIETALRFWERTRHLPVHILFGLLPLKSARQARYFNEKVPGVRVGEDVIQKVEEGGRAAGIALCRELYGGLREFAAGAHLFPIGDLRAVYEILDIDTDLRRAAM